MYRLEDGLAVLQDKLRSVADIQCENISEYPVDGYHDDIIWSNDSICAVNRFYENDFSQFNYEKKEPVYMSVVA